MADIGKTDPDVVAYVDDLIVRTLDEMRQNPLRIRRRIKRLEGRKALADALSVAPFRFKLLYMGRIEQHDSAEITGRLGGKNLSVESLGPENGEKTGVVNMCVCDEDIVDVACLDRKRDVLKSVFSLFHAVVDKYVFPCRTEVVAAAGHFVIGPYEHQLHGFLR